MTGMEVKGEDTGDTDGDNSFKEFCKEERNGTVAGRRSGVEMVSQGGRNNSIFVS